MFRKIRVRLLAFAASAVLLTGCVSAEVEYPKDPTPPPQSDPGSTVAAQSAQPG